MNSETDALENLYTTVIDRPDSYEKTADIVDNPRLQPLVEDLRDRRARHATELRDYLASADLDLEDDGTVLASAHRQYLGFKDMVSDDDDMLVAEVIRGEHKLLDAYDEAIRPMDAASAAFALVTKQHGNLDAHIRKLETLVESTDQPSTGKELS